MALQVLEQCRISPAASGDSPSTTTLPLTFLDLPWFAVPPVQRLFFYDIKVTQTYFIDTMLPNIKHSLSLALQLFYPLSGNLIWPPESTKPEILYLHGHDSVPLTVALSTQDFHHLSANHVRDASEFSHLAPNFGPMTPTDKPVPLLCLQVTLFPNSGICSGITANHVAADGRTSVMFMKTWASACESQDNSINSSLLPFYGRDTVVEDENLVEIEQSLLQDLKMFNITKEAFNNSIVAVHPVEQVRATFVILKTDVIRLKQWLFKEKQISEQLHLTTFVLTCAYIWVCLTKTRIAMEQEDVSKSHNEQFGFAMDIRDKLSPPLPATYFGNCFTFCVATSSNVDLNKEDGIATAAVLIAKAIQRIRESPENFFYAFEGVDFGRLVTLSGSPKLAAYDTDFGWGKPRKVEVVSIGKRGSVSMSESPDEEGGVELGLVMNKKEMDVFSSLLVNTINSIPSAGHTLSSQDRM